jgi:hypothetical protein
MPMLIDEVIELFADDINCTEVPPMRVRENLGDQIAYLRYLGHPDEIILQSYQDYKDRHSAESQNWKVTKTKRRG